MKRDRRYKAVKSLIISHQITTIKEIFDYIPLKIVYTDMGFNYTRFKKYVEAPGYFSLNDLQMFSRLLDIPTRDLIEIALSSMENKPNKKAR